MRRQPPIARCFIGLCFSAAVTLAAFEWRNPFPDAVVTLDAEIELSADEIIALNKRGLKHIKDEPAGRFRQLFSGFSKAQRAEAVESEVELILDLSDRLVELRVPDEDPILYEVAVGQDDWQTPTGEFKVMDKREDPAWQHPITKDVIPPGTENPLGTRWIAFWSDGQAQIGFHGTNQEDLIGEAVSHGCVRMRNQDIEAIYAKVEVGTIVTVKP
ncbi:MAG: L,D-transpeptidase [Cyanobacteria bacterium P01_D01_bin.105]